MADEAIKRKLDRAIKAVSNQLNDEYKVRFLDGGPFHIEAIRKKDRFPFDKIRNIRVTIDEPSKEETFLVLDFELPDNCTKEIWCRNEKKKSFKKLKIF